MGYACPVCAVPQRDGEHLAHHLAFTAMIHGDDHEAWLDEHVPDWADRDPHGLAERVVEHAEAAEYHEVFEDTVDRGRPDVDVGNHTAHGRGSHADHGQAGHARHGGSGRSAPAVDASGRTDPETAAALEEARELTRELYDDADDDEAETDDAGDDEAETDGAGDDEADDDTPA